MCLPSCCLAIHVIMLSFLLRPGLPSDFLLQISLQELFARLFSKCYMFHLSHSFLFVHPNNLLGGVQIIKLLAMKFSPSTYKSPDVLFRTLFPNTVSPRSFFNVRDQFRADTRQQAKLKLLQQFLNFQIRDGKAILTELPQMSLFLALFWTYNIACRPCYYCESEYMITVRYGVNLNSYNLHTKHRESKLFYSEVLSDTHTHTDARGCYVAVKQTETTHNKMLPFKLRKLV
jgi:hypothetical protein